MSISIAVKSPLVNVALELNGIDRLSNEHHVRLDKLNGLLSNSFTIEAWVKPFVSGVPEMTLFSYYQSSAGGTNCFTYLTCKIASTYIKITTKSGNGEQTITFSHTSDVGFTDRLWHHLVITWAGVDSDLSAFWDSSLLSSSSKIQIDNYEASDESGLLVLGQYLSPSDGRLDYNSFFSGQISNFRIWSAAWSKSHVENGLIPNYVPENTWTEVETRTTFKKLAIYDDTRFGLSQQGYVVSSPEGTKWSRTQPKPTIFNDLASCKDHLFGVDDQGVLHHSVNKGTAFYPLEVPLLTAKITQVTLNDKTSDGLSLAILTDTRQVFYYLGFDTRSYNPMSWLPLSFNHQSKGFQLIGGFVFFQQNGELYFQHISKDDTDVPFDFHQPKDSQGNDDLIVQVVSQWPWNDASFIMVMTQSGNLYRHNPSNGFWDPVQNANNTFVMKDFGITSENQVFALDDRGNLYKSSNRLILSGPDDISLGVRMTLNLPLGEGYGQTVFAKTEEPNDPDIQGSLQPSSNESGRLDDSPDWVVNNRYSTLNFIQDPNVHPKHKNAEIE